MKYKQNKPKGYQEAHGPNKGIFLQLVTVKIKPTENLKMLYKKQLYSPKFTSYLHFAAFIPLSYVHICISTHILFLETFEICHYAEFIPKYFSMYHLRHFPTWTQYIICKTFNIDTILLNVQPIYKCFQLSKCVSERYYFFNFQLRITNCIMIVTMMLQFPFGLI